MIKNIGIKNGFYKKHHSKDSIEKMLTTRKEKGNKNAIAISN